MGWSTTVSVDWNHPTGVTQLRGGVMGGLTTSGLLGAEATHHFVIFHEHHVIGTEGCTEDDAGDSLKAVDPLLPLWSLPSHIKHPEGRNSCFIGMPSSWPTHTRCLPLERWPLWGQLARCEMGGKGGEVGHWFRLGFSEGQQACPCAFLIGAPREPYGICGAFRGPCTHLKFKSLMENLVSMMPVVLTLDRSTSCSLGR